MQTAMETYYTDEHTYVGADLAALQAIEPSLTPPSATKGAQPLVTVAGTATTYTITVDVGDDERRSPSPRRRPASVTRTCTTVKRVRLPVGGAW